MILSMDVVGEICHYEPALEVHKRNKKNSGLLNYYYISQISRQMNTLVWEPPGPRHEETQPEQADSENTHKIIQCSKIFQLCNYRAFLT
jgi:hypothetical protein